MTKAVAVLLATAVFAQQAVARDREVLNTTWDGFQRQVSERGLIGRGVRITVAGGKEVRTHLRAVTEAGLSVSVKGGTLIPREQVERVRFNGRIGKGRIIGLTSGLAGGAAIGGGIAASTDVTEGLFAILIPASIAGLAAIGGVAGYFIGRAADRPAPEFVIAR